MHGDGSVTRNFLYVADAVEAFDKILHQGEPGEVYNVGTDFRLSVIELAKYLIKKVSGGIVWCNKESCLLLLAKIRTYIIVSKGL